MGDGPFKARTAHVLLPVVSEADALAKIDVDETLPVLPIACKLLNEKKK